MYFEPVSVWGNRLVEDYNPIYSPVDMVNTVYRIRESWERKRTFKQLLRAFAREPELEEVTALVLGNWGLFNVNDPSCDVAFELYKLRHKMPRLTALFAGDISGDEAELSWIRQWEWGAVINAYPELEEVVIRGGHGLHLAGISHENLESLTVQSAGLSDHVIKGIANIWAPKLEKLELWLGQRDHIEPAHLGECVEIIRPLFWGHVGAGGRTGVPALTSLGLCNCSWIEELLEDIKEAPLMSRIKHLDLRMGVLEERGLESLLESPWLPQLETLWLEGNYIQDLELVDRLRSLGPEVILGAQRPVEHSDYRFVEIWE